MIKKIIFDLDNTLIMWKEKYLCALEETIKEFGIDVDAKKIDNVIESLEIKYKTLSKEKLLNDINKECNLNLNMNFINTLFKKQSLLAPKEKRLIQTIEYLNTKYKLVVLTNYFTEVQQERLKTAGILKYFENVYGGDQIKLKPNKQAFLKAIYPNKISECIMIGDSFNCDVRGALNIGLKVIAFDHKNIIPDSKEYIKIKKITDLKEIL